MNTVLWASVLYFLGAATVLYFRPNYMFYPTGEWREFGFNQEEKTLFPFWLFCIVWAILSYVIVYLIIGKRRMEAVLPIQSTATMVTAPKKSTESFLVSEANRPIKRRSASVDLRPGYYMLNRETSDIEGVPKYVYLGEEEPHID